MNRGGAVSRPPFHRDKPFRQPHPSTWRPRPPPPAGFTVALLGSARDLRDLGSLLAGCPARPDSVSGGLLYFRQWCHALDALAHLWDRRLAGAHRLTPRLMPSPLAVASDREEEEARLLPLFVSHARALLTCDAVCRLEHRIVQLSDELCGVGISLSRHNSFLLFNRLQEIKERLVAEREVVQNRLAEFRAAIGSVLKSLGELGSGEEDGEVAVFNFREELDWRRLHAVMERECRRLEDGLPIYAFRRKILKTVADNQVMVLIGETGSGKSTQLVQFLADSGLAADGSIVCTQPRKVAAMSLARRVAVESNGCYADNSVISYPTYSSSQSFNSKVIFMTDHCLLHHCMNDMSMAGMSYVIIDEAHERSLNTDLLLALIKKKLLERFDLRLIIMSATADASKLSDYFYGCCTFHVVGRTFPVDIKYVPDVSAEASGTSFIIKNIGSCAPYVTDVLKMVSVIHRTEKDGAILAFLTSQMEVEWACENFDYPSAIVLPMHGKLSCEDQNRVFQNYSEKRKIIFSTNVAETSLTIPGVKFVVDSGMVKDSKFEPGTGINMLKVGRISQSSANQRAGRAGRTEAGKCYRLYSECDFQSMQLHQEPEIRKVHLGIAVLRILALGIKNVQDFEFVDAPNPKAIDAALQNLIHLDAIVHHTGGFRLTDTGRRLVKLGMEPRLGKIILECFSCNLRKEGLVLAAVMANASSIFCRVGSDEEKYKADCMRVSFCHRDGDLFTLLSVYKEWENEHGNKNKWCWDNSINAKSMRRCQETVLELEHCLRNELNIIVPSYWVWNADESSIYNKLLKKVIHSSLSENIAMYSGYDRLGYEVAITGQQVQLHPSCSLLVYGQKPNWVVFGDILSISNQYLVCVTAIDYECLCGIQPPLFDIAHLESRKMHMNVITVVGNSVLRRFCGKTNCNLQSIVSRIQRICMDSRIGINVDFEKREIQYFAQAKDMEMVSCIVNSVLECESKWLSDECIEKCLFHERTFSSPCVALFGSGAEIKHLELEKRFLTVEVSHPHAPALDDKELLMMIHEHVPGIAHFYRNSGNIQEEDVDRWGKITFLTPEAAEIAIEKLNKLEFHGSLLKVLPAWTSDHKILPFSAVRVKICWPRRLSKGVALVSCSREDADCIVQDCCQLEVGGRYVSCEVSTKYTNCIFVTGIPKDISESELYNALQSVTQRNIRDVHLLRGEAINSLSCAACADTLVREIAPFMPKKPVSGHNFRVEVFSPEPKDYMMKAMITFDESLHLEAAKALDHIQGKVLPGFLSWQKIQCQHMFYSSVSCPARVYHVIKKQLNFLLEGFRHKKGVLYKLEKNDNGSFRVKISANATKTVADLRRPLEQLMKGMTVSHSSLTSTMLQVLLSRDGIALMKALERDTGTYILYDKQHLNIKLFGPPDQVAEAEKRLIQSLLSLHENKQLEIRLRGRDLPPDLMKEVVQRFGPGLHGLKEGVPGVDVALNTRRHILSVKGSKDLKQKVEVAITELVQSLGRTGTVVERPSEEASCPICLCELEDPYMLEACGHYFCRACLIDQCESAARSREGFPLCCTKEGCNSLLLLVDLRLLLSVDKLEELFRASLGAFVAASAGTYRFCPTPDCPAVYQVTPCGEESGNSTLYVCGACGVDTCTRCHLEYHPFISCKRYRELKDDPDKSLVEWRKGKEHVKDCPCCNRTIEKMDGCNHVECPCGVHVCWVCLEFFRSSDNCYSHLRLEHGNIA